MKDNAPETCEAGRAGRAVGGGERVCCASNVAVRCLLMCLSIGLLAGCGKDKHYHYAVFTLTVAPPGLAPTVQPVPSGRVFNTPKPMKAGEGDPSVCETFFSPSRAYIGRITPIPQTATAFAVVVVTDGDTSAIVPLFTWLDEGGTKLFGCNGPSPLFALSARTGEELIKALDELLRKERPNA
ncbi:MAG: hypothetical protein H7A46_22895 [Verrucomicrobiales bacterium]|nr:hypothetical protein [Verrucomicrobiales bacterium]